jgi:hypothetical protein
LFHASADKKLAAVPIRFDGIGVAAETPKMLFDYSRITKGPRIARLLALTQKLDG